jgi:hypothetical protein
LPGSVPLPGSGRPNADGPDDELDATLDLSAPVSLARGRVASEDRSILIDTFDDDRPDYQVLLDQIRAAGECAIVVRWKPGDAMDYTVNQTSNVTADDREFVILALAAEQERSRST